MALSGKLVSDNAIKCDGYVFYELFKERPYDIAQMCPDKIQSCELEKGRWGTVGSIIFWKYCLDGHESVAKEIVEAIDEGKKLVTFNVIEGDLMELYKTLKLSVLVEPKGQDYLVRWSIEYEKLRESIPEPHKLMKFCLDVTKDIDTFLLSNK